MALVGHGLYRAPLECGVIVGEKGIDVGVDGVDDASIFSLAFSQQERQQLVVPSPRVCARVLPSARAICARSRDEKVSRKVSFPVCSFN